MITLKVEEMSCNHCVSRINQALTQADIKHEVNLDTKTVSVEEENVDRTVEILDDLGFTATK